MEEYDDVQYPNFEDIFPMPAHRIQGHYQLSKFAEMNEQERNEIANADHTLALVLSLIGIASTQPVREQSIVNI